MISRKDIEEVLKKYDSKAISIGVLGSHSAEEVGISAKANGLPCVVVCQKGRDELYTRYSAHLFDYIIMLDKFSDIVKPEIVKRLQSLNTIFIPNRSFSVYVGYENIEERFLIPLYGNRALLRLEERTEKRNQYWLLEKAGIKTPKRFSSPNDIDRLVIVKTQQKAKPLERAFFYATSTRQYWSKAQDLINKGIIDKDGLEKAIIEEYVLGQKYNANFQSWALPDLFDTFDLVGFDDRKQTNLHGLLSLPARDQLDIDVPIRNEEIGHYGLTMRESQKPLVYSAAESFYRTCRSEVPPGVVGLFALQGAVAYDSDDPEGKRLAFYVFDVSLRVPGCPCVGPTSPEMRRLTLKYSNHLRRLGLSHFETPMDLPMLEIMCAKNVGRLPEVVT
ncbi:MAG: DUF1297 domain-containing protein [Candidatus Bathyarchaeia archaeon]